MAIWNIPHEFRAGRVETNAKEFLWIENTDGNYRGLACFDLESECKITIKIHLSR